MEQLAGRRRLRFLVLKALRSRSGANRSEFRSQLTSVDRTSLLAAAQVSAQAEFLLATAVFPLAIPTSTCLSSVTICSGLYLLFGIPALLLASILAHFRWYKKRRSDHYVDYYHRSRTHLSLEKDCPNPRPIQPPARGKVIVLSQVGGLHHRYQRLAA